MKKIKRKKITIPKNIVFGVRRAWAVFCVSIIASVLLLEAAFSWYLLKTIDRLDAPVEAEVQTNLRKIKLMDKTLDDVEGSINLRIDQDRSSSQNPPQVIE